MNRSSRALLASVVLVTGLTACSHSSSDTPSSGRTSTSSEWTLDLSQGSAHIAAAGLAALPSETLAFHLHAHLDVNVDGQPLTVPAYLGMILVEDKGSYVTKGIAPLHTHDTSGIIHVEAPKPTTYRLGQVFQEWGVRLDRECLGTRCVTAGKGLRASVNGKVFVGNPADVPLGRHDEIFLQYGDVAALAVGPGTYDFPSGK